MAGGRMRTAVVVAALLAAACGGPASTGPRADVRIITHGQEVDLAAHLAPGKYTVFDFYAAWCPPCRIVGPALERLAAAEDRRLAVRKVDIVDWTMPVVDQHGIESLPHLMLYDTEGRRIADGDAVFAALLTIFGDAAREVAEAGAVIDTARPPAGGPGVL